MKSVVSRISLSDYIDHNEFISCILNSVFSLFFFTLRKIYKLLAYRNGNVAIISLHRLGDTIFTIPAINKIKNNYKKNITIVCYPESIPLYKLAFDGMHFCKLEHQDFYFNDRIAKIKAKKILKSIRPEIIIDLIGSMASASLVFNLRAREIVGINKLQFRAIYDHYVDMRLSPQLPDIYLDVIAPVIKISDRNNLKAVPRSINPGGKILIHPFAAWREKEWKLRKFFELALKLKKDFAVNFILPPGKICADLFDEINKFEIDIIETSTVDKLIQNIKECSLFIGNDSGPVNIANFFGRPTFTIYGATNPDFTATYQEHQLYIQKKLDCSARSDEKFCIIGGSAFLCPGIQCMQSLSVDEVYYHIKPLVKKYCNKMQ
ncbi:MAG: glycosyltransferase family 9 protein [Ignavibacteriaceae bacterium]|nr:glycosyltransferase family 9 protein [Ignavibacteriaceae bacterium]MCW9066406.1 glycosyltransferase family 9 protein [Ignavibacteriaceae bacterium]